MVQTFWRTFASLVIVVMVFSGFSWIYIILHHIALSRVSGVLPLLNLPTGFPSIWNVVHPADTQSSFAPFVVLFLQVYLTGGLLGTLLRVNSYQTPTSSSFVADGLRAFGRLLVWNILWTGIVSFFLVGILKAYAPLGLVLAFVFLIVRYLFLFAEIALVSETSMRFNQALRASLRAMKNGLVPMIPFATAIVLLTGAMLYASTTVSLLVFLPLVFIYVALLTWILHTIVARYLYYSDIHTVNSIE